MTLGCTACFRPRPGVSRASAAAPPCSNRPTHNRTVVADTPTAIEELRKVAGDVFVPTLIAGRFVVRGFEPGDYESALEQAGFQQKQAAAKP